MLTIRQAQARVVARSGFMPWLYQHVWTCFTAQCEAMGEHRTQEQLEARVERAQALGFDDPLHIARFVDLSFVLGFGFEDDPTLSWARRALTDERLGSPAARIRALHAGAIQHLKRLEAEQG